MIEQLSAPVTAAPPIPLPRRIFVYGSLRTGEYNNYILEDSKRVNAEVYIIGFELVSLGTFPAIVPSKDPSSRVIGELWDIDPRAFTSIERMEIGAGYKRIPVTPIDPGETSWDSIVYTDSEAYVYGNPPLLADCPRVPSGDWSQRDKLQRRWPPSTETEEVKE